MKKIVKKTPPPRRKAARDPKATLLADLGARVKARRLERGLTQEQLAQELELSVAYVSLIERGGRNPPITTVVSVANALDTTVGDLVG